MHRLLYYSPGRRGILLGAILLVGCFFWYTPLTLWHSEKTFRTDDFLRQCENPLTTDLQEPILGLRIAIPTLVWLTHCPPWLAALLMALVVPVVFLAVVYWATRRRWSEESAMLAALAVSGTMTLQWGLPGGDTFSHLLAAVLLFPLRWPWRTVLVLTALLTDERIVLALPFLALWHNSGKEGKDLLIGIARWSLAAVAGLAAGFLVRHAIQRGWIGPGLGIPPLYEEMLRDGILSGKPYGMSWPVYIYNLGMANRALWAIPVLYLISGGGQPGLFRVIYGGSLAVVLLMPVLVLDVARSAGFAFPLLFVAMDRLGADQIRPTLRRVLLINLFIPVLIFNGPLPAGWWPLPCEVLRLVVLSYWEYDILVDGLAPWVWRYLPVLPLSVFRP